jgi:pimeloyl-ACP methyl ester carboxylesterase
MKKFDKKRIMKILYLCFIYYSLGGVALYFLQDYILFHPVTLKREHQYNFSQPHRDLTVPINEKDVLNLVDFLPTDSIKRGVVLYFHGNKKNISWYADYMPMFTSKGYEVLMIDYPGFGKSQGKLTEKKLYDWALQVYKIGISRFGADSIIIYGKSMGTD